MPINSHVSRTSCRQVQETLSSMVFVQILIEYNLYKSYGLQTCVLCCRHQVLSHVRQSQIIEQLAATVGTREK